MEKSLELEKALEECGKECSTHCRGNFCLPSYWWCIAKECYRKGYPELTQRVFHLMVASGIWG